MAATATRTLLRSSALRAAASRIASSEARASRPPLPLPKRASSSRILRFPAVLSCCVDSLMPMHSTTAAALMTSMLSVSVRAYGWISEAGKDDV